MANEVDKEALAKLLESDDTEKCFEFFRGMPEKQRRECFAVVKPFWKRVHKSRFIEDPPGTFRWNPLTGIASLAYFATATGSEIIKAKRSGYPEAGLAFDVLADRRPDWIGRWIETLLSESHYWQHWHLIRRLIVAGLAEKPTNPRYFLGMISGINGRRSQVDMTAELEREPDLLKEDVWKLFEYDGEGENSLANTERFERSWIEAFLKLMDQGKLPRAKLLESCVDALERDFNHYRAKWFYEFFDRLEPTDQELKRLAERLLGLLGVSAPNVAAWALGRVAPLAKSGTFETSTLCHALSPILRTRAKGTVMAAIKLLEHQAVSHSNERSLIAAAAAQALAHDSAEVQKGTLKFLASVSSPQDEEVRAAVEMHQSSLNASARPLATKWLASSKQGGNVPEVASSASSKQTGTHSPGDRPPVSKPSKVSQRLESLYAIDRLSDNLKANTFSIPAAIFDGTDIARLVRVPRVVPIESVEELIDVCARVIEDGSLVDDAERCIDGLARLIGSKPTGIDLLTAPLLKRIRKLILKGCSPFCGMEPANDIMGLFYAFCTGTVIEPLAKEGALQVEFEGQEQRAIQINTKKPLGFLSSHCLEVARRIGGGEATQLLSTPTHAGGWIDPRELAKRANSWSGAEPHAQDVILALLRLAPEHRAAALESLADNSKEWFQAIRYALGAEKIPVGDHAALWVAAARARAPWLDDAIVMKKHPGLGPDAAEAAKLTLESKIRKSGSYTFYDSKFAVQPTIPTTVDPLLVTVIMYSSQAIGREYSFEMGGFAGRTTGAVRWTASIWPQARESYFASSAVHCFSNLDWSEAQWQNRTMLEPLIDSATPLRYAGLLLLVSMLAAKEPGESGLATDIALRAVEDGRLGSDTLGNALAELLPSGMIKPSRWHKTLREIARASAVHAAVIQLALQRCFESPHLVLPKDSGKLLELLFELSLELRVPIKNELCRTWLASSAVTGKSLKLAKDLLAIEETLESKESVRMILEQAVAQRTIAASGQVA